MRSRRAANSTTPANPVSIYVAAGPADERRAASEIDVATNGDTARKNACATSKRPQVFQKPETLRPFQ